MPTERTAGTALRLPLDVPATPKLTPRQARALDLLRGTGSLGIQPAAFGASVHFMAGKHALAAPCDYCASSGNELLRALRRKGVARQRRVDGRTFWQATGLPAEPMGDLPEGF